MANPTSNSTPNISASHRKLVETVSSASKEMENAIVALEEARKGEERLRLAIECGQMATWDWDILTGKLVWSDRHYLMQGYSVGEVEPSYAAWLARVHPDDRLAANEVILRSRESKVPYRHEFRSLRPDGTIRWLSAQGQFLYDNEGNAIRMIGVARDITVKRLAEQALRDNEEKQTFLLRLADALRSLTDPLEIQGKASQLLGEYLGVTRVGYAETLPNDQLSLTVARDWHCLDVRSVVGQYRLSNFGGFITELFQAGRDLIVEDTLTDGRVRLAERLHWEHLGVRASICHPVLKGGHLVACLFVHDAQPRKWRENEIALLHEVAERTWVDVERAKAEVALRESEAQLALELEGAQQLQRISSILINEGDTEVIKGHILEAARSLMRSDMASFQMFIPERNELFLLAHIGFAPESAKFWEWVKFGQGSTCGFALEIGQRVVLSDVEQREYVPESQDLYHYRLSGIRSCQTTILRSREGRLLGMLSTHWHQVHTPSERDLRLFDVLARQAADLIERQIAQEAIRTSEERLRAVAANLPRGAAFLVDHDFRYIMASGQALGPAGFNSAELEGKTLSEVLPPQLVDEYTANYRKCLAGNEFQTAHSTRDRYFITHGVPVRDSKGRVTAALAVSYDVTDTKKAELAREQAEDRLRLALGAARMGTWRWESSGDRHYRDANFNRLLGCPPQESTGSLADFLSKVHPEDRGRVAQTLESAVRFGHNLNSEFRVLGPEGTIRWLRDQGDVFDSPEGRYLAGASVDITELKEAETALLEARDHLEEKVAQRTLQLEEVLERRAELTRQLTTVQEEERRRVSRELHDSVGQLLTGLSLALKAVETGSRLPDSATAKLAEAKQIVETLGLEVHTLATRLRPTALDDLGLEVALNHFVAEWARRNKIRADLLVSGLESERLPTETETTLYRIVQEALNNVARHAQASSVSVVVNCSDGVVKAVIEDDGIGFDPDYTPKGRLGILGMSERATLVGGDLEIETRPEGGTTIFVRIPLPTQVANS